jgi:hypothetical protein
MHSVEFVDRIIRISLGFKYSWAFTGLQHFGPSVLPGTQVMILEKHK